MKKLVSFLLVLAMILSMGTLAFADGTTTIPFELDMWGILSNGTTFAGRSGGLASGGNLVFRGLSSGIVESKAFIGLYPTGMNYDDEYLNQLKVSIASSNWGKALGGDYTAQITFTSEVVVEE